MQFGVCVGTEHAAALKAAGFDFVEVNVQAALQPEGPEEGFRPELEKMRAAALPCLAANCLLPGALRVTGPQIDIDRQTKYLRTAFERAKRAGIRTVVFGSGGARRIPDGFERAQAWEQLVAFGGRLGAAAAPHGVTVVVEPLNAAECNVLTTVAECARLVREIAHPAVRLLVDAYHWGRDNDRADDLVAAGPLLRHAHIATYAHRQAPGLEACDFAPFFRALREGGYDGPLSIEGRWNDVAADAPRVIEALRRAAAGE